MEKKEEQSPTVKYFQWALQFTLLIIGWFTVNLLNDIKENTAKIEKIADRTDSNFFQIKIHDFVIRDHEARIGNVEKKVDNTEKRVAVLEGQIK